MKTPEQKAREQIDQLLTDAGWSVQSPRLPDIFTHLGVAIREEYTGDGPADYLLVVDGLAVGILEAKREGITLSGVFVQAERYAKGEKHSVEPWLDSAPLPFLYVSTGKETMFRNGLEHAPRSRHVFAFHKPETIQGWMQAHQFEHGTLRGRLQTLPINNPLITDGLWPPQIEAINNLEQSLADNRPRALIQMATGSGKTFTAVNTIYRLIKFAGAKRIVFLVDRTNLGRQALKEFQAFEPPDDGRKFIDLYNVQLLTSSVIDPDAKVVITTIQRLYAALRDDALAEEDEEATPSAYELEEQGRLDEARSKLVTYQPHIPIEMFDFVVIDECHRSIYNVWRQVLDYFDAFLIGLTATPTAQTIAFFGENLVMAYSHEQAVIDGINVDGDVYRIQTQIGEHGATIEAGYHVGERDRRDRLMQLRELDDDFVYRKQQVGRDVINQSRIRLVIRTFRDDVLTKIFPGRTLVPKTLIFAKDDNHAEEIVHIVREEFGRGDAFCQKVTYRAERKPDDIVSDLRNRYNPRIAVTVDMIATGTDVKPLECLIFLRDVQSLGYFEQMRGRGVRDINDDDLRDVNEEQPITKDRFVIVDAVGVTVRDKRDTTKSLNRKPHVSLINLLEQLARKRHPSADDISTLAARLARLHRKLTPADQTRIETESGGKSLSDLMHPLHNALNEEAICADLDETTTDYEAQRETAIQSARDSALKPLRPLFPLLRDLAERTLITYDEHNRDALLVAEYDEEAAERARTSVESFEQFIHDNRDRITALRLIYSQPYQSQPLTLQMVKELAEQLDAPPHRWTTQKLWEAYQQVKQGNVRGAPAERRLADLVALVRHVLLPDDDVIVPFPDLVRERYGAWLAEQASAGRTFTPAERWWLDRIANHIGVSLAIAPRDLDAGEFQRRGGRFAAIRELGSDWQTLLTEMNEALAIA